MKISFHGACREVTGSCILVETDKVKFVIDCGMFQGARFSEQKNFDDFAFNPKEIDFAILTHAHLDHCGRLPKLYQDGFRQKIYATSPTIDLARVIMSDSAHVLVQEAALHHQDPLYLPYEVDALMNHFSALDYGKILKINNEVKIRLRDAGHILGSAIVEVWLNNNGREKKLVFSGDLGNPPAPIVRDPEFIDSADLVVIESTYGNRVHEPATERLNLLRQTVIDSIGRGGTLMIPSFALERTQEVLYELNYLIENKKIPAVPIFVDSPLAIRATSVYEKYRNFFDSEANDLIKSGDDLFNFPGLVFTETSEQSKKINSIKESKVILAGSGMCVGGRIPYHLKYNLGDAKNHLLIISYQVDGSLGRNLLDGAKTVWIDNEKIQVRAGVSAIGSYSSHADQPKLLNWLSKINKLKPKLVIVEHGEEAASLELAKMIEQKNKIKTLVPEYGKIYEM